MRAPFAGSLGTTVESAVRGDAHAFWPMLHQGFFGRSGAGANQCLGIGLPVGQRGGPVFDRHGRLSGMALPGPDGADALLAVTEWPRGIVGELQAGVATGATPAALDEVYEAALRLTLQVPIDASDASRWRRDLRAVLSLPQRSRTGPRRVSAQRTTAGSSLIM